MPYEFKFPDVGEGIHEGEIVKWLVKEGDEIEADAPLGEVETDKAVVEMPSPKTGKILKIHVKAGDTIKVGETMVTILEKGESTEKPMQVKKSESKKGVPYTGSVVGFLEEAKDIKPVLTTQVKTTTKDSGIIATPAVRNLAKQKNVELSIIKGTGPEGRITFQDVEKASGSTKAATGIKVVKKYDFFGYIDRVPLHGVRKTVAKRMTESIFTGAQLTNMYETDVTELFDLREKEKSKYKKEGIKLTFFSYLVKICALCLKDHPYLNASLEGEEIILKKYYNIGIAVDTKHGLYNPVIKGAQEKDIKTISKEIEKLANDSRSRKINLMDLKGSSFSISNLGAIGVEFFTPIINYPESAILGVGRIVEKPVVRNGKIEIRKILPLSLTYDHRIVDGAEAARFMIDVMKRLEKCEF